MKTALITGGSKGIGFGIAEALMKSGWNVVITGRSKESLEDALKQLKQIHQNVISIEADVRNFSQQEEAVKATIHTFGQLDALIANAGIGHFSPIESMSFEQWHETIDINLTGVFYSIKSAIPELKKSHGYVITIASLAGTNFFAGGSAYNASKFGLVGFTQAVMMDLRAYGIKVSTIMPGSVATNFNGHSPVPEDAWKIQPEDIGELVVDLLRMNPRTLPSKIEVRPSMPPGKA